MLSVRIGMGAPKTSTTLVILPLPGVIGVLHHQSPPAPGHKQPQVPTAPTQPGQESKITLRIPHGQQDRPGTHPAPPHPNSTGTASPGALAAAKPHASGPGRPLWCHLSRGDPSVADGTSQIQLPNSCSRRPVGASQSAKNYKGWADRWTGTGRRPGMGMTLLPNDRLPGNAAPPRGYEEASEGAGSPARAALGRRRPG